MSIKNYVTYFDDRKFHFGWHAVTERSSWKQSVEWLDFVCNYSSYSFVIYLTVKMSNQNSEDKNKQNKSNGNHNDEKKFHGNPTKRNYIHGKDKSNSKKRQHPFNCIDVLIPGKIKKGRRNDVQSNTGTVDKSATPSGSIQHDAPIGRTTVFFVKVLSKSYVGNNCIQQHMLFVCEILLRLLETHLCSVSS